MQKTLTGLAVIFCSASWTLGTPLQWAANTGGNDHFYEFVFNPNIQWTVAKTAAQALTFGGVQGHLATITSAPESAFMASNFSAQAGPDQNGWVGAYQDTNAVDYSEPSGGWRWVTGESWSYTNWFIGGPVEPDNFGGGQNYVRSNVSFQWDDFQNDPLNPSIQYISGYFVEYPIPEPASGSILLIAGTILYLRRDKRIL